MKRDKVYLASVITQFLGILIYTYLYIHKCLIVEGLVGIVFSVCNIGSLIMIYALRSKTDHQVNLLYWMLAGNVFFVVYKALFVYGDTMSIYKDCMCFFYIVLLILLGLKNEKQLVYYDKMNNSIPRQIFTVF